MRSQLRNSEACQLFHDVIHVETISVVKAGIGCSELFCYAASALHKKYKLKIFRNQQTSYSRIGYS